MLTRFARFAEMRLIKNLEYKLYYKTLMALFGRLLMMDVDD